MQIKTIPASEKHKAFNDDVKAVLRKYQDQLTAEEMLALASHLVGVLLALQNQHTMTKEQAIEIMQSNIEAGNQEAMIPLLNSKGNA